MQHNQFNNDFQENLLTKIQTEKKLSVLAADFNSNPIKYQKTTGINQSVSWEKLCHYFMPQITQITQQAEQQHFLTR